MKKMFNKIIEMFETIEKNYLLLYLLIITIMLAMIKYLNIYSCTK